MIRCPVCNHMEYEGALYCSECGTSLHQLSSTTQNLTKGNNPPPFTTSADHHSDAKARVVLFLVESGQRLTLERRGEWTLGRLTEGQALIPDIDLSPYQAYEQGISRLHAAIRIDEQGQVTITDVGSSNGTRVNGIRIPPDIPHPLQHGDMVALGKLVFQILIQPSRSH